MKVWSVRTRPCSRVNIKCHYINHKIFHFELKFHIIQPLLCNATKMLIKTKKLVAEIYLKKFVYFCLHQIFNKPGKRFKGIIIDSSIFLTTEPFNYNSNSTTSSDTWNSKQTRTHPFKKNCHRRLAEEKLRMRKEGGGGEH